MTTHTAPPNPERSLGQLVSDLSEQTSRLVRAEIDLAKAEVTGRLKLVGAGAGLLAVAGLLALYLLAALIATAIIVLDLWLDLWLAALIVTVVLLLVVLVLALLGLKSLKKGNPPTPARAIENVQQDVAAVKEGVQR
ncbi:phage holin family protein [Cellulomonas sp. DKR-3]|uniref:Phage holin family protein n=1 Tax=Cellulomonas fulva TaxID=2835530 RepID=A0ABS5TY47_9CELL|nr:phage holin family protein [Cellulomonas fulva]MBT0994073.1 phage holin family protein [Cellulomonas fulva]